MLFTTLKERNTTGLVGVSDDFNENGCYNRKIFSAVIKRRKIKN